MKMKGKIISLVLILSLITILFQFPSNDIAATQSTNDYRVKLKDLTERNPITITHDDNFSLYPLTGDGSSLTPYLIDSFNITSLVDEIAISVSHTTKHFIIKNCYLRPTTIGISLNNVTQGTAQVVDNTIEGIQVGSGVGIYIKSTNSTFVANNTYLNPEIHSGAFDLEYAHHTTIFNNTAYTISGNYLTSFLTVFRSISITVENNTGYYLHMGMSFYECNNAIIAHNTFTESLNTGISLNTCPNSTIDNNILINCGFQAVDIHDSPSNITNNEITNKGMRITTSDYSQFRLYQLENNLVNNKKYGLFVDTPNLIFDTGDYSQIIAYNCSNMVVENIVTNDISQVITFYECSEPSVKNCEFTYSTYSAISFVNCTSPEAAFNSFTDCEQGLGAHLSDFANITHNIFYGQFFEGVIIDYSNNASITYNLFQSGNDGVYLASESANCSIHHNTFEYSYARDNGVNNTWYDPVTQEGNYWWDYIGSGNYTIPGSARSNDTYPLGTHPVPIIAEFHQNRKYSLILLFIPLIIAISYKRKRKK